MYDVIVVGGGHAGVEACFACAKKGFTTALVTSNIKNICDLPCNPSIGGSAKGIVVREIDALGGVMARVTDKTLIQMKMLNKSSGPGVRSLRSQVDKVEYKKEMQKLLLSRKNLTVIENTVEDLIIEDNKILGVVLKTGTKILSSAVILTTGTYLKADILVGDSRRRSGPNDEEPSNYLSDNLKRLGFKILRLKTGTPARIDKSSINFDKLKVEDGDKEPYTFSFDNIVYYNPLNQTPCHLTYTSNETHRIINENLDKSSMYGGYFDELGTGPRYCPSIEDKIVRFSDKDRHQIFIEPESKSHDNMYIQGFSTSMPKEIQELMIRSLPGLENAVIKKYAYAIEYDAIEPTQLYPNLETKLIENLFTAGQINGTSGYEEAACQGLMAGINACLKLSNQEPFILKRNEAYTGVLIDDLVTKGTIEPYRLLTSRAEFRLLLRHDNADARLMEYGYKYGLVEENKYQEYKLKMESIENLKVYLESNKITPNAEVLNMLKNNNLPLITSTVTLYDYVKRTDVDITKLTNIIEKEYSEEVLKRTEIDIKYKGYIDKSYKEVNNLIRNENIVIPKDIDYKKVHNLATEAVLKLDKIRPNTIGQASRISGVNMIDITILTIYLKKEYYGTRYF